MTKHTILFLAANPLGTDRLALDREARAIQVELERSGHRDQFEFVTRWAAEPLDLLRELRRLKPTIVHFSGNGRGWRQDVGAAPFDGDSQHGLFFQGSDGLPHFVSTEALGETFGAAGSSVKLVVLNACYCKAQAGVLLAHVDCIVGMRGPIHEDAARNFAIGFYGGLGERESIAAAYKQGRAAIKLDGLPGGERSRLKTRDGIDAARFVLAEVNAGSTIAKPTHPVPDIQITGFGEVTEPDHAIPDVHVDGLELEAIADDNAAPTIHEITAGAMHSAAQTRLPERPRLLLVPLSRPPVAFEPPQFDVQAPRIGSYRVATAVSLTILYVATSAIVAEYVLEEQSTVESHTRSPLVVSETTTAHITSQNADSSSAARKNEAPSQIAKCTEAAIQRDWMRLDDCAAVLRELGASDEAVEFQRKASQELKNSIADTNARTALRAGRIKDAAEILQGIDSSSVYFKPLSEIVIREENTQVDAVRRGAQGMANAHGCNTLRNFVRLLRQGNNGTARVIRAASTIKCVEVVSTSLSNGQGRSIERRDRGMVAVETPSVTTPGNQISTKNDPSVITSCDMIGVDDIMQQAANQYKAGFANAALWLAGKALACKQDSTMYLMAELYACAAHDTGAVKRYYRYIAAESRPAVLQRCQQEGISPSLP